MIDVSGKRIMLYPGYTDGRLGFRGLMALVGAPEEGVVYCFCGRSMGAVRLLECQRDRAVLAQVRLFRGKYQFPCAGGPCEVSAAELRAILDAPAAKARIEGKKPFLQRPAR